MIKIIREKISKQELKKSAHPVFVSLVKAVVDVGKEIMAVGGELHSDEEAVLLEDGSEQKNLWGVNIYPDSIGENMIGFDSMINIRPRQNNRSRGVENKETRTKIISTVNKLICE